MIFDDAALQGPFARAIPLLEQKLTPLLPYNIVKVGQSTNVVKRWRKHRSSKFYKWQRMIVLYSTSSHRSVCKVEKALIAFLHKTKPNSCINVAPGGEGVNCPDKYQRYYIYVLVGSKRSQEL